MSEKIKVSELTIEGIVYVPKNSIQNSIKVIELNGNECPYVIGNYYLVRTVTMIQLGKLINITDKELILDQACWVGDTGRFSEALTNGESSLKEIEMIPDGLVIINRGAICDVFNWKHKLPIKTK